VSSIVLTGIVRNESAGIVRTLDHARPLIDCVAISDTGSTDGTPELIEAWMRQNNVPGLVVRSEWPDDFAVARNRSLEVAKASGCTWLCEIDSDWLLVGNVPQLRKAVLGNTHAHAFQLEVQTPASSVYSARIRRCDAPFVWDMPVHEELHWLGQGQCHVGNVDGAKFIYANTTPLEKAQEMYRRDIEWLSRHTHKPRAMFFIGQSYANLGEDEKAVEWYLKRAECSAGHPQERAIALFRAGRIKKDPSLLAASYAVDPSRAEPLWELAFLGVKGAADLAARMKRPAQAQFVYGEYYGLAEGVATNNAFELALREKQVAALFDLKGVQ
jgi:glycosyltransferase involved in cell wall biosynthesis